MLRRAFSDHASGALKANPCVGVQFNFVSSLGFTMKIHAVLEPYCNLMRDIKIRLAAMKVLALNPAGLPDDCVTEFQQLQIRMISETLAIACLLVHGDIEGARSARLSKAYQADFIMNALEQLHPRFYPQPVKQIFLNGVPVEIENVKEGFLTKAETLKSYRDAANFLHVGSLSEFLANETAVSNYEAVRTWVNRLRTLLNIHCIYLADEPEAWEGRTPLTFADGNAAPKYQIIVQMNPGPDGDPIARLFETIRRADSRPGQ